MVTLKIQLQTTLCGCNRSPNSLVVLPNDHVVFGSNSFLAYSEGPLSECQTKTLPAHKKPITVVTPLFRGNAPFQTVSALLTGSADHTVIVWRQKNEKWVPVHTITQHSQPILSIGIMKGAFSTETFAVGSSDGIVTIWSLTETELVHLDTLNLGNSYAFSMVMAYLPHTDIPMLIVGGTDKLISIYCCQNGKFEKKLSLSGHLDWIRCLDICQVGDSLLLASGAQDKYIRLWKIFSLSEHEAQSTKTTSQSENLTMEMIQALAEADIGEKGYKLSTKAQIVQVLVDGKAHYFNFMFDALLMGHDDWVHSVEWAPVQQCETGYIQPMRLLTASADKSMILWTPEASDGVWMTSVRLGEISGVPCGYYGAHFGFDGQTIVTHSYMGSLHYWRNETGEGVQWMPKLCPGGHVNAVEDLRWDPSKTFLASCSSDETTRLFAPWKKNGHWYEIARPQIHGYGMRCLAFVDSFTFVSGADEKVVRVFEAPITFVKSLNQLVGCSLVQKGSEERRALGAALPALGLTNKAVYAEDMLDSEAAHDVLNFVSYTSAVSTPEALSAPLTSPPLENHLRQHTLWPELDKLYGHGYELMTLDVSKDGQFMATACKASKSEHAAIRLWSTDTWKEVCDPLMMHSLTVTCLRFSHHSNYLASVSRDRGIGLYKKSGSAYVPLEGVPNAHGRIIWKCTWTPDDQFLVTVSRDKTIKLWALNQDTLTCVHTETFEQPVTVVDVCPEIQEGYRILIGLESGEIVWLDYQHGKLFINQTIEAHVNAVKAIQWRDAHVFASGSSDGSIKIFNIQ